MQIKCSLSDEDAEELRHAAREDERSVSGLARVAILDMLDRRGRRRRSHDEDPADER